MNLLLSGEDEGHGYRAKRDEQPMVTSFVPSPTPVSCSSFCSQLLHELGLK